jgi:hypothetical protein
MKSDGFLVSKYRQDMQMALRTVTGSFDQFKKFSKVIATQGIVLAKSSATGWNGCSDGAGYRPRCFATKCTIRREEVRLGGELRRGVEWADQRRRLVVGGGMIYSGPAFGVAPENL